MKTLITRLSALLVAFALVATAAHAQTSVGTVEGTVTDEQGAVLPGATATLTGPRGSQTATTDEKGMYRFVSVQPGDYTLKLDLGTTFTPQTRQLNVGLGRTATIDFTMKMASLTETVEVVGAVGVGRRQKLRHRHVGVAEHAPDDAALFVHGHRPAERCARHQQQLRLWRPGQLRQRAAARRRRHARSGRRLGVDVLQPEPDRGNPDRRPWRAGGIRRLHGRDHQHGDQVRRQRVLGPLLDALHQRGSGVERTSAGSNSPRTRTSATPPSRRV